MNLPDKINVCGVDYTVSFHDALDRHTGFAGVHCPETLEIKIQSRCINDQRMEQTFFHELLHAIDEHFLNGTLDEEQICSLSKGVYQVFRQNGFLNTSVFDAGLSQKRKK